MSAGLAEAAAFISRQWPVFPCGSHKRPLTEHGFKDAVQDADAVRRMFRTKDAALIGVPTGTASGLVVVDLDVKCGGAGLEWLAANEWRLPQTRRHGTRSGGLHLLFVYPPGRRIRNTVSRVAPGVDVRGEGGYFICPPSEGYTIADDAMPAVMPDWLVKLLDPPPAPPPPRREPPRAGNWSDGDGTRYGLAGLARECEAIRNAGHGAKHDTLNRACYSIGGLVAAGELAEGVARRALEDALNDLHSRTPCDDFRAALRTLGQAFQDGMAAPRQPPPERPRPRLVSSGPASGTGATRDRPEPEPPPSEPPQEPRAPVSDLTEDGVALAYAAGAAGKVVFDHTERRWAEWDGGRWRRDGKERVFDGVRRYVRDLRESAEKAPAAMAKAGFISAVERFVRADPRIAVEHDVWDADPWVLGVPGGVVDLRTGTLREGRPEEYVSRQCSVAPAPAGTRPELWLAFLETALGGDQETIRFLQKFLGYCLTGDVREEVLAFFYGGGGNGKGVFLSTWTAILGEYAVAMPMEAFTAGSGAKLEYYRARMAGHRLVTASETETGAAWAESQIKELTGNEAPVSARHPHGRPFEYRPQFKLGIVGNHAPALKGRSAAMERRLRVVPFDRVPPKPDDTLKARLREEYPAILRWMIEGCLAWQAEKLGTSPAVARASGAYFEAQDGFGRWLEDCCILDGTLRTKPATLLASLTQWAKANGEEVPSAVVFGELIDRHPGLKRTKIRGERLVVGVGMKASEAGAWSDR